MAVTKFQVICGFLAIVGAYLWNSNRVKKVKHTPKSPRADWLTRFLSCALCELWGAAQPPYSGLQVGPMVMDGNDHGPWPCNPGRCGDRSRSLQTSYNNIPHVSKLLTWGSEELWLVCVHEMEWMWLNDAWVYVMDEWMGVTGAVKPLCGCVCGYAKHSFKLMLNYACTWLQLCLHWSARI